MGFMSEISNALMRLYYCAYYILLHNLLCWGSCKDTVPTRHYSLSPVVHKFRVRVNPDISGDGNDSPMPLPSHALSRCFALWATCPSPQKNVW